MIMKGLPRIRVLVVDDSPFMRMAISRTLEPAAGIEVVGQARNGIEAMEKAKALNPDVITLDMEMPVMGGLETLKAIMTWPRPIPCVMVSSFTTQEAEITLTALDEGAIDFITKPSSLAGMDIGRLQRDLANKIIAAAHIAPARLKKRIGPPVAPVPLQLGHAVGKRGIEVVCIGISTGGPAALQHLIPVLPANLPVAVVVAQHMPPGFTKSMAERLNKASHIPVKEAEEGDIISPGRVLLAKSGMHLVFNEKYGKNIASITHRPDTENYFPSVNVLFGSAAHFFGNKTLPVVMTGMGVDGTEGLKMLKKSGAFAIAQSEESCAVYGMPKSAIEGGLIDRVAGLEEMASAIIEEL